MPESSIPVPYTFAIPPASTSQATASLPDEDTSTSPSFSPPAPVDTPSREPSSGKAAKDKPRRACDPCRLRRVKCERQPGQDECIKCQAMKIKCIESVPKARNAQKGARIAEAKRLYGDTGDDAANEGNDEDGLESAFMLDSKGQVVRRNSLPTAPSHTSTMALLSDGQDAAALMEDLIPGFSSLKICAFPLLRWMDLAGDFRRAGSRLSQLSPVNQAMYMVLAALAARSSNAEFLVGKGAPTLLDVGKNGELRHGTTLCQYGARRDRMAAELLNLAIRKINDNGIFSKPDARAIVTLSVAEMLILAWTLIIRDAVIASATGRALDFTSSDIFLLVKVNEATQIGIPSGAEIADDWPEFLPEGPGFMQLWTVVLRITRTFVIEISQPLAIAQPRLHLHFFDNFWSELKKCRESLSEAVRLSWLKGVEPAEQAKTLGYTIEFLIVQAFRIISWRYQEEQLQKADVSGIFNTDLSEYRAAVNLLHTKAQEEAFQAGRRVIHTISSVFQLKNSAAVEFFLPGYIVYEGLLVWAALLLEIQVAEAGGRADYPADAKVADLLVLREAVAVTGWSSGHVLPHLQTLDRAIVNLQALKNTSTVQPFATLGEDPFNVDLIDSSPTLPLPTLPPAEPHYGDFNHAAIDYNLFSLDELNSAASTDWLEAFLAQTQDHSQPTDAGAGMWTGLYPIL